MKVTTDGDIWRREGDHITLFLGTKDEGLATVTVLEVGDLIAMLQELGHTYRPTIVTITSQ